MLTPTITQLRRVFVFMCIVIMVVGCASPSASTSAPTEQSEVSAPAKSTQEPTQESAPVGQMEDLAPESIKAAGMLRVGSQETYVPAEFHNEGGDEVVGFTADLLHEITRRWGVGLEYINVQYSALIPGLEADRFDIGSGGMSPNPERLQVVEMVGYWQSGATFIIKAENAGQYPADATAQNMCGKKVGMLQGSSTLEKAFAQENEKCAAAGKEPINIETFDTTPNGLQQVALGRLDAYTPDYAQAAYIISTTNPGEYALVGTNYFLTKYPTVWTVSKTNPNALEIRDAIIKTLSQMMDDGTYMTILEKWGVEGGAIVEPAVNSLWAKQAVDPAKVPALPERIKSAGVLRVGSQETYVPAEFHEEGGDEVVGFTSDLLHEITRRWGVDMEYINVQYSALIPGLEADRFDIGSGGMSPNPDRLQVVEMVGYFQSGATFIVKAENGANYPADATAQDMCGKTVGMLQGSSTLQKAFDAENEKCAAASKEPINIETFDTTPNGLQQVLLGRIEAYTPDFAQTLYIIKTTPGEYSTIGTNYYLVKYPIVWTVSKTNPDAAMLRDALTQTLSDLMADGTYQAILRQWGVEAGAIKQPAVNSLTAEQ